MNNTIIICDIYIEHIVIYQTSIGYLQFSQGRDIIFFFNSILNYRILYYIMFYVQYK